MMKDPLAPKRERADLVSVCVPLKSFAAFLGNSLLSHRPGVVAV
jgi:hypothetical protein